MASNKGKTAVLKENYCYVTYSESSASLYRIGIMPYSLQDNDEVKSFALTINFLSKKGFKSMKGEEVAKEYSNMKKFFGAEGDDKPSEGSLGGRGNTRLTNSDGDYFFGYIFSARSGQKALEWFIGRSVEMKDEETHFPLGMEDEEEKEEFSSHFCKDSLQELAMLFDVKLKEKKSKTYSPKIVRGAKIDAPLKSSPVKPSLPTRTGQIPGIPTSRKPKETTNEDIQNAINLIFKAVIDGKIVDTSRFEYYWEDPTGATTERGEDEKNIPEVYKGFVGTRRETSKLVKDVLETNPTGQYDTGEIEPTLVFRLMSHRKVPK
jgi:hypothetical protein